MSNKLKMVWLGLAVFFNASGLKATFNKFTGFARGITFTEPKTYHQFFVTGNEFTANYKYLFDTDISTYNSAIYSASIAPVSPQRFKIYKNTFDKNRLGIYVSNINNVVVSENTITLRKPLSGTIYKHYGIYALSTSNDSIKINTISTLSTIFSGLSATDKAKYTGAFLKVFLSGNVTDNDFSNFSRHIEFNFTSQFNRVLCNLFKRGLPTSDVTTPTNTFYLDGLANLNNSNFGTNDYASNNYWDDFTTTPGAWNERFRGANIDLFADPASYYYQGLDNTANKYRPIPFTSGLVTAVPNAIPTNSCNQGIGGINALIINTDSEPENQGNAIAKSGEDDSTIVDAIENYEPTYTENSNPSDFFADMANYSAGLAYASAGLTDSTMIEQNYNATIAGDIIALNEAVITGDSNAIAMISSTLPRNNLMLDNLVKMATYELSDSLPNASDTLAWQNIAYTRVLDGGPAVVYFRNRLEIIVDETTLPPSNSQRRAMNGAIYQTSIYPNPSKGTITIVTNTEALLQLEVHDVAGQLVYQNQQIANQSTLNLGYLENGIYTLHLRNGKIKLQTFKWVLSK